MQADCVAWFAYMYVCLLVTFVNPVKTVEPIEMLFRELTQVVTRNHVLDESRSGSGFWGCLAHWKARRVSGV